MSAISYTVLLLLLVSDLQGIQRDLERTWGRDNASRSLRTKSVLELRIDIPDQALTNSDFPMTTFKERLEPYDRWTEDITRKGNKYRRDIAYEIRKGPEPLGNLRSSRFYNGHNSWVHDLDKGWVEQSKGSSRPSHILQDYYGDMIGNPRHTRESLPRSLAGQSGFAYGLVELIPTGEYVSVGRETIDGRECILIERPSLDRLWMAEELNWAIIRREWHWSPGGPLKRAILNQNFRRHSGNVWLPQNSRMDIYGHPESRPNQRVGVLFATLIEAELDVSDEWFEPRFPAGTRVIDLETGTRIRLGEPDQTSLEEMIAEADEITRSTKNRPSQWRGWHVVAVCMSLVIIWIGRRIVFSRLVIVVVCLGIPTPRLAMAGDGTISPEEFWREQKRCGINCLYAYMHINEKKPSLEEIYSLVPIGPDGSNMADLKEAANRLGLPSRVVRSSPEHLERYPLPTIAHLQGRGGHFVLVLAVDENDVVISDMTRGRAERIPRGAFEALWSGYLIVPGRGAPMRVWVFMAGGTIAAAVAVRRWRFYRQ